MIVQYSGDAMNKPICTLFASLFMLISPATSANPLAGPIPDKHLAKYVVEHLDLRTFPSSISFKSNGNRSTFADYGIVALQLTETKAVLENASRDWRYEIQVINHDHNNVTICFHDLSESDNAFDYQSILSLRPSYGASLVASRDTWIARGY